MIAQTARAPRGARLSRSARMRRRLLPPSLGAALVLAGSLLLPGSVSAHPVITIAYRIHFSFSSKGLRGLSEVWRFDQVHSEQIAQMFNLHPGPGGTIDSAELPALKQGYFDDLRDYSYFTTVVVDGREVPTKTVTDFSAAYRDSTMIYRFFVPLDVPAAAWTREVDVTIWDPTYFTDLSPEGSEAVTLAKPPAITASVYTANDHRHFYHLASDLVLMKTPPFYLKMQVVRFRLAG